MAVARRAIWYASLLVLVGLAWVGWSRPPASPADLAHLTPVVQNTTFTPPHRAVLRFQRQAPPWDALTLSLRLTNTGPTAIEFVVGVCDFRYGVVRVRDEQVLWQTDTHLGCLLAGLGHRVLPGQTEGVAGTVLPLGRRFDPPLHAGHYVAFASLATPEGVIVAEPLSFRVTRRGEIVTTP
ncbi:hypothetical protein [Deinococcus aestuarii]|uniref:hypothetical protein n=1 Tax=Deinococcus aestuarii TaxID=2774531 RepID=UPI001C0E4EFA|nr:hypothetical protein [Deinococcus aestuarii]